MEKSIRLGAATLAALVLYGCGSNTTDPLSQGSSSASRAQEFTPVPPADQERVATGGQFTVGLSMDGKVYAWGDNSYGQLGDGTLDDSPAPQPVQGLSNVRGISAGGYHTVATLQNGTMWGWGSNHYNQLGGAPTQYGSTVAQPIEGLSRVRVVSANHFHNVALTTDGGVYAWGSMAGMTRPTPTPVAGLSPARAVAAGANFALALKSDGTVWAWGSNSFNELGQADKLALSLGPLRVDSLDKVTAIAAGNNHALALRADGSVWAWGRNNFSQAGNGTGARPSAVEGLPKVDNSAVKVKALAASAYNSAVLYSDGSVWAWGRNYYGQLGLDKGGVVRKPVRLSLPGVAVGLAMASDTIIVLNKDGSVYGIGVNSSGQVGNNTQTNVLVPAQVSGAGGHGFLDLGKSAGN